ncbi:MAG: carbohydrate binding domain-containing protein, partial [Planctomycetota bacterium]
MKVEIPAGASDPLEVYQSFLKLEQGVTYTISFMAKADAPRTISVNLMGRTLYSWQTFWIQSGIELTTEPQIFTFEYTHTGPTVGGTGSFNSDIDWRFNHSGSDIDAYYDHIWLGVGPPPPPLTARFWASEPDPADDATDVPREVLLNWRPGEFVPAVNGHIVYLSENFSDVNDGIGGITQSAGSYAPPQRLDFETTYYWRVDEVNAPPDSTVHAGDVWSFRTEPVGYPIDGANITATASSAGGADLGPENTINGSGLDADDLHSTAATDMWLSDNEPLGAWLQYEFDNVYKLNEMWVWNSNQVFEGLFGFGFKDVTVEY